MALTFLFLLSTLLFSTESNSVKRLDKLGLNDQGQFVDSSNNVILLHGFNSVVKEKPYYDPEMTNRAKLTLFNKLGVNVIRLGVIWTGLYPQRNQLNRTYLQAIEDIVEACSTHGIYTIIDMHQDVLSTKYGSYDGIPRWLIDTLPQVPQKYSYPWPFRIKPDQWFLNYLTYDCAYGAQNLYTKHNALMYWADYWTTIAQTFVNTSSVLGYELINEPPPGNFYDNHSLIFPGNAGKLNLLPVYDYLVDRIRKVDQETLIFYEPVTYSLFFPDFLDLLGTGFYRVPGSLENPEFSRRSVLSYHYYCWLTQTADPSTEMTWFQKEVCHKYLLPTSMHNAKRAIARTGGGKFLTEFGLCAPDGNPASINTIECNEVLNYADYYFESWAYWDGNFLDEQGDPIKSQIKYFSRPYPQLTAGIPQQLYFHTETGLFQYSFNASSLEERATNSSVLANIYFPVFIHYPDAKYNITLTPSELTWELKDVSLIIHDPDNTFDSERRDSSVTLVIERT